MASPTHWSLYEKPDPSYCQANCNVVCEFHNLCPSPPPPLLVSTPAADDSVSTSIRFHRHSSIFPALPIAAGSFLAGALLLFVAVLYFIRRRRREQASSPRVLDAGGDFLFEGGDHEVDHHVWYIRTVGLDETTIGAITAWAYKSGEDGVLGSSVADCAVCLGEFRDGELLRLLPKCGHAFHQTCIDTWLRSHINCPLCRAPIVAPNSSASAANSSGERLRNVGSAPLSSSSSLPPSVALESANSRLAEGADSSLVSVRVGSEQEINSERLGFELQDGILINQTMGSELGVSSCGLKTIHRSPSMDSLPLSVFIFRLESGEQSIEEGLGSDFREGQVGKNGGEQELAPKRVSFLKERERSFSSVSRRFSLSRIAHARSSILPL